MEPLHPIALPGDEDRYLIPGVGVLTVAHSEYLCRGRACTVHAPTGHHMVTWPMGWDEQGSMLLRQCQRGVWHPDPDERPFRSASAQGRESLEHDGDGCCSVLWCLGPCL